MAPRLLCKDCWTTHDGDTLLAACPSCDEERRFHRKEPFNAKRHPRETEKVCKKHRTPLLVYCGNCTTRLSLRAVVEDDGIVAIAGDSGAGKSTFLYVLRRALGAGRQAPVQIRQAFGNSDEQLKATLKVDKSAPDMTPRGDAIRRNYAWELVTSASVERRWIVAFHDAGGGTWKQLDTLGPRERPIFLRFLKLIGGAIFVIDGERVTDDGALGTFPDVVQDAIDNELRIADPMAVRLRTRNDPVRIAVVITKSDVLWGRPGCAIFREGSEASPADIGAKVKTLLEGSGRKPLLRVLESIPGKLTYFAVSALGEDGAASKVDDARPERIADPVLEVIGLDAPQLRA